MAGPIVFFVGIFLLGITSGQTTQVPGCSEPCSTCKTFTEGNYTGTWNLVTNSSSRCPHSCLYQKDGKEMCFCDPGPVEYESCDKQGCSGPTGPSKKYCQPGQNCWPTHKTVTQFSKNISGDDISCLGLPKFVGTYNMSSAHNKNYYCLPYNGLLNNIVENISDGHSVGGDLHVCKSQNQSLNNYLQPNPNCDLNPFITGSHYKSHSNDQIACMSPYQFLSNRNYKEEWMPAFIVTANTTEDVQQALIFANNHNLGVAVMSTGHELQDRNAGPGPNSLLIRTTCFRDFTAFPNESIQYNNSDEWTEGYATVGAGLTFGQNYWYNIKNAEGLYPLTYKVNREIVGGSCHSVGIVGWMLGGGKGWTTPMYGLGVDQLLDVDLVLADGTSTNANYTYNTKLFNALRGGGPGFGVITSLKMKLHKPGLKCNGTMKGCYTFWSASWIGKWTGQPAQVADIKKVLKDMIDWNANYNFYWNSLIDLSYNTKTNNFSLSINAGHFGTEMYDPNNYNSFTNALGGRTISGTTHLFNSKPYDRSNVPPPITTDKYFCEIFPNKQNTSDCLFYPWTVQRWSQSIRFLVDSATTKNPDFLDALIANWQPMCDMSPYSACSSGFQLHYFFTSGHTKFNTGGSISGGFRKAATQVFNTGVNSNKLHMTFIQKEDWMHYSLAPAMYKFSNASYLNEAEYTLNQGQWEDRFWGKEIYEELLQMKNKYDQEYRLNCRHCVGSKI